MLESFIKLGEFLVSRR